MEMDRRSFVKGGVAFGSLAAMGVLTACSPAAPKEDSQPPTTAEAESLATSSAPVVPDHFTDGKWIGRVMGHRDYLTVSVEVRGGDIANIQMLRCDETIGIGTVAAPIMAARILADKNLDVDTVSGATRTSLAVRDAVAAAIEAAGGNPADYQKGAPAPAAAQTVTEDVDVVVVGGGTAGLVAAVRLLESGKKVTVVEKLEIPGGSGNMTYSGVVAVNSKMQTEYIQGRITDANRTSFDMDAMMAYSTAGVDPQNARTPGEAPFIETLFGTSASLVDWMQSIGVGFLTMGSPAAGVLPTLAPGFYMGGAGHCMSFMADRVTALGGNLHYSVKMTEFIKDSDGKIAGIKAEGVRDGSAYTINAKAVCMATGGFAANKDMLKQYYPDYADFSFNCCPGSTGEGMQMAIEEGAVTECMGRPLGAFCSVTPDAAGSRFEVAFLHMFAPGIMVNNDGSEFGNGFMSHAFMAEAVMDPANGNRFFQITDYAGSLTLEKMDSWQCTDYDCLFSRGDIVRFDTVEEAAEVLKLPNLPEAVAKHNEHALAGDLDEFGRACTFINANEGIYAISVMPTFYLTTGGIAIDTECHVLDAQGSAIPNLYAAGDICGSVEEKDGKRYGYGFDSALTYGYIMGNTVAAEV